MAKNRTKISKGKALDLLQSGVSVCIYVNKTIYNELIQYEGQSYIDIDSGISFIKGVKQKLKVSPRIRFIYLKN